MSDQQPQPPNQKGTDGLRESLVKTRKYLEAAHGEKFAEKIILLMTDVIDAIDELDAAFDENQSILMMDFNYRIFAKIGTIQPGPNPPGSAAPGSSFSQN